ncbi:MAG: tripartite tricarboxylate transporter substrate binding protein [Pseudomonadota bacterium]
MKTILSVTAAAVGLCAALAAAGAGAQVFPTHAIRLVVPAAAGGSTDIGARIVARRMAAELGQPVVVDNKGGGGGRIGAIEVAHAPADGYTLLYGNSITHALLPGAAKKLQYDALKDFVPAGQTFWYSTLVVCNPGVPFNDIAGLIRYGKQNPGQLSTATAGPGSGNHFSSELLASMAGISILAVPYKGNAPAVNDVMAGLASCTHITEAKPYVDSGRLKPIATTGLVRDPRFPKVPTIDESGLKGYDVTWWQGVFAPAGTPAAVMARISAAVKAAVADPETKAQVFDQGMNPQFLPAAEVTKRMEADIRKFHKIAVDSRLDLE